jgi:replication factor C subunit 3/5
MIKKIEDYDFYNDENSLFNKMIKNYNKFDDLPNILVYGSYGIGKKSRIYSILQHLANDSIYNKEYIIQNDKVKFYKSAYHIEFDLIHYNLNDKCILETFLKNFCETRNIGFDIPKIVIFFNAHLLSKISQYMLRRIIEINSNNVRFIFSLTNLNKLIEPLKSRFILMRIPTPSKNELLKIINKENNNLTQSQIDILLENCDNNINKIKHSIPLLLKNINIIENYKIELNNIFDIITSKNYKINKHYYQIRNTIYELYTDNNNENILFEYLYKKVLKDININNNKKMDFIKEVAILNHKMSIGNKEPLYLERLINTILFSYHS